MIKIEHIAIWVNDLERMKRFYQTYFEAVPGDKYHNPKNDFTSYFLSLGLGCRLELMHSPEIAKNSLLEGKDGLGLIHLAISVGTKKGVDSLTEELRDAGYKVIGEPRTTGDGYYESVVLDPEDNKIEITI